MRFPLHICFFRAILAEALYLVVALDSVDEGLICHDLGVSFQEGLETVLHCLQLLLCGLCRERRQRTQKEKERESMSVKTNSKCGQQLKSELAW